MKIDAKPGVYESTKAGVCNYRSKLECSLMRLLDSEPSVEEWGYETEYIRFRFEGRSRGYIPDFTAVILVDGIFGGLGG